MQVRLKYFADDKFRAIIKTLAISTKFIPNLNANEILSITKSASDTLKEKLQICICTKVRIFATLWYIFPLVQ